MEQTLKLSGESKAAKYRRARRSWWLELACVYFAWYRSASLRAGRMTCLELAMKHFWGLLLWWGVFESGGSLMA